MKISLNQLTNEFSQKPLIYAIMLLMRKKIRLLSNRPRMFTGENKLVGDNRLIGKDFFSRKSFVEQDGDENSSDDINTDDDDHDDINICVVP